MQTQPEPFFQWGKSTNNYTVGTQGNEILNQLRTTIKVKLFMNIFSLEALSLKSN